MKWSQKDLAYLKRNYSSDLTIREISNKLNRSIKAIKHKAARESLSRKKRPHNKPKDKDHRRKYDRDYYNKHKRKIYSKKQEKILQFRKELKMMLGGKCNNCGYNKCLAALEFHHNRGNKEAVVSKFIKNSSKQKALKESEKCILLCANCHRELHHGGS